MGEGFVVRCEGLWAGRVAGPVGRRRSLAGCAGLSMAPGRVPLSTCAWAPAPATAGGLHRWSGGCVSSDGQAMEVKGGSAAVSAALDSTGGERL